MWQKKRLVNLKTVIESIKISIVYTSGGENHRRSSKMQKGLENKSIINHEGKNIIKRQQ